MVLLVTQETEYPRAVKVVDKFHSLFKVYGPYSGYFCGLKA